MAALWRRTLAFFVDALVIGLLGFALGYIFFDLLMGLGPAGRLVGFFAGLAYFAIPESSFGNGQSLGKRFIRVQVVGIDGAQLPIERSCIRYTIFAIPWFLSGLALPISRANWAVTSILGVATFGLGGASLYLMLFNRHTRQGVHDLVAGGFVAEAGKEGPLPIDPIWKPHWILAAAILVLSAAAAILLAQHARAAPSAPMREDIRQVEKLPGVQSADIRRLTTTHPGVPQSTNLLVEVRCTVATTDEEALANQVADSLITIDPSIDQYGTLRIVLIRGYDIGIAHSYFSQTYSDSPAGWKRQFFAVPPQLRSR